ncbi:orotidine-5'-phosphate decarboxylase [Legionella jordanis]|uniref:orotidine-5'-phosphate decarboxylase n=1 Tax=Legionella jordanis TaxID=456 RepID=UPI0007300C17
MRQWRPKVNPKLIVAFDFHRQEEAFQLLTQLNPKQCAIKIGSEMFTLFGTELVRTIINKGFKVFLDLKFHDIPNTVAQACHACANLGVWMINVHACGGLKMMQAAREALNPYGAKRPLLIAVTVLTSMTAEDLIQINVETSVEEQVQNLACLSKTAGLDGVVCSAFEVPTIKNACGPSFITVTPGIRLPESSLDDQARIMTPSQAIQAGSDYLVIGRPITRAPSPSKIIDLILTSID